MRGWVERRNEEVVVDCFSDEVLEVDGVAQVEASAEGGVAEMRFDRGCGRLFRGDGEEREEAELGRLSVGELGQVRCGCRNDWSAVRSCLVSSSCGVMLTFVAFPRPPSKHLQQLVKRPILFIVR